MNDWKVYKIGDVCQTISDTFKGNSEYVVLINTSDVLEGKVLNHEFSLNKNLPGQFKKTFRQNDILYSEIRPQNKRFAFIDFNPKDYVASTKLMVLRCNQNLILPEYFYFVISDYRFINKLQLIAETRSGTFPQITFTELANQTFYLPSIEKQKKIVKLLSSIDLRIESNRKINARLEELAQAIFKSWFIDFTPFGGQMPQDWEECNLEDVLIVKYGKDHKNLSDGPFPVYGSGGIMRSVDKPIYEKESVLIPRKGTLNNIIYVDDPFWSVDTMFFTEMKKKNLAKYIFFLLKRFDFQSMNSGSAIPSMTRSILYNLRLNLPAERILEKFESIINPFFLKIKYLQKESARLAELRDTLLPKLMSGEIKV